MNDAGNHIDYFKFIDSFGMSGCPLCSYILVKKEGYFQHLLYEGINDKYLRRDFTRAGGFCSHHTNELAGKRENITIAMLYDQIYADAIDKVLEKTSRDRDNDKEKACMLCEAIATWKRMFLSLFRKHAEDDELKTKTAGSDGFCIPHITLLQKALRRLPVWFRDAQKNSLEERRNRVRACIDAGNFSVNGERAERPTVVRELIRVLYGHEGAR